MISWIIFAVIALFIIRIAIIFLCPSLDDFMSGGQSNAQDNDYPLREYWDSDNNEHLNPNDSTDTVGIAAKYGGLYSADIGKHNY